MLECCGSTQDRYILWTTNVDLSDHYTQFTNSNYDEL